MKTLRKVLMTAVLLSLLFACETPMVKKQAALAK
jgi:hypothetical protein